MFSTKSFSKSTVLGLALGILLMAYAVFAFQSPTQPPPQGNVPAPLNTGPADQTKTGGLLQVFGLWVNQALGVSGGATFGGALNLQGNKIVNVGAPTSPGDAATKGFVDTQTSGLQKRVSGSCPGGQGIRTVNSDGTVTCEKVGGKLSRTVYSGSSPPSDGLWHAVQTFTIPSTTTQWGTAYQFSTGCACNGCCQYTAYRMTCDGAVVDPGVSGSSDLGICTGGQTMFRYSPVISGTGKVMNCAHEMQTCENKRGSSWGASGRVSGVLDAADPN